MRSLIAPWVMLGLFGTIAPMANAGSVNIFVDPGTAGFITVSLPPRPGRFNLALYSVQDKDKDGKVKVTVSEDDQKKATKFTIQKTLGGKTVINEVTSLSGGKLPEIEPFVLVDFIPVGSSPLLGTSFSPDFLDFSSVSIGDTFTVLGGVSPVLTGVDFFIPDDPTGPLTDPFGFTSTPFTGSVTATAFTRVVPTIPIPASLILLVSGFLAVFALGHQRAGRTQHSRECCVSA